MTARLAWLLACAVLAGVALPADGARPIAVLLGQEIRLGDRADAAAFGPVSRLYERLWGPLSRHYIDEHKLAATTTEIDEAASYHREFDRKDRAQRARKLDELNRRLAADDLVDRERAWLEEFRAVLVRLEQRDAEIDDEPPPDPAREIARLRPWVEMWKLNRSLYERYGGVVALTSFGPDPRGARAALFAEYERSGRLRFEDRAVRDRLFEWLEAQPSMVLRPEDVDFTPFWKRPIPASYLPD